ncbi:sodium:solute symporter [Flammeovirgaceae bacterium SG7u.111]|nr:sodium:solute symporter [Flammeovirgaceae bacterium SG7u.132]WPO35953.1 sodium:solute symporter [Flammeovirgaceae bacterium SG7u.111]
MSTNHVILNICLYFLTLFIIAYFTARGATTSVYFNAEKKAPWFLVAIGSVGAFLSGFLFLNIPGFVGTNDFSYIQRVFGYLVGYSFVATILLPLFYKLNVVSIYQYLEERLGFWSHKTGSVFFILSRLIATAFMVYVSAKSAQSYMFEELGFNYGLTVFIVLLVVLLYSMRGGIKTIVFTDVFHTIIIVSTISVIAYLVMDKLGVTFNEAMVQVQESEYSKAFFWDTGDPRHFFTQFFAGVFIAVVMNGLDQAVMQKHLSCATVADAQKNMIWFSIFLVIINIALLTLGALLYIYADAEGMQIPASGNDFYVLVIQDHLGKFTGLLFMLGLIAATCANADSSMIALTSAFTVDFLEFTKTKTGEAKKRMRRIQSQIVFAILLFLLVILFNAFKNRTVVDSIYTIASYTYGPLIGLFAFGIFTKWKIKDQFVPAICAISTVLCYLMDFFSESLFGGYQFGYNLLMINGGVTFVALMLLIKKEKPDEVALANDMGRS